MGHAGVIAGRAARRATRAPSALAISFSSFDSVVFHVVREVRGAIRGAACSRLEQCRLRVRHADDEHAVMEQRQLHAEQRAFLSAVRRGARGEHAGGLVDEPAGEPKLAGRVEEMLQRRRHVAEPSWAAEQQPVRRDEVGKLGIRWPLVRHRRGPARVVAVTGGTVRSRATPPAPSTPRAACRASAAVRPLRE